MHRLKFASAGLGVGVGGSGVSVGTGVALGVGVIVGVGEGPTVAVGVGVVVNVGVIVEVGVTDGVEAASVAAFLIASCSAIDVCSQPVVISSVAHRMGSTAFLLAEGTMRPARGVPPWTTRWDMCGSVVGTAALWRRAEKRRRSV